MSNVCYPLPVTKSISIVDIISGAQRTSERRKAVATGKIIKELQLKGRLLGLVSEIYRRQESEVFINTAMIDRFYPVYLSGYIYPAQTEVFLSIQDRRYG